MMKSSPAQINPIPSKTQYTVFMTGICLRNTCLCVIKTPDRPVQMKANEDM